MSSTTKHLLFRDGVVLNLTGADDLHTALARWCAALEELASRTAASRMEPTVPLLNRVVADVTHLLISYPHEPGEGASTGDDAPEVVQP